MKNLFWFCKGMNRSGRLNWIVLCGLLFFSCVAFPLAASAVDSAGDVVFTTNQVLGQNGDYPFAGIYVFDNLTLGDNVEITSSGISQLVIKVNGRLTLGKNAVIRVRNGYYPAAPTNPIAELNATNLTSKGILSPEGIVVYPDRFGRGGDGGNGEYRDLTRPALGGGGGFGGGNGGRSYSYNDGLGNGGNGAGTINSWGAGYHSK